MTTTKQKGNYGEDIAIKHLTEEGFVELVRNWRLGKHEVDIIAYREGLLVFVEVKTRTSTDFGTPEEAVDINKRRAYVRMANAYVLQEHREEEVRFDIIAVNITSTGYTVNHIENAFDAIGLYL